MPIVFLYITVSNIESAKAIARTLLDERLIACANILGPITSLYRWDGENKEESEVAMIAKTTQAHMENVIARVEALHDYSCPCIVALPIVAGFPPFLNWVAGEVSTPAD